MKKQKYMIFDNIQKGRVVTYQNGNLPRKYCIFSKGVAKNVAKLLKLKNSMIITTTKAIPILKKIYNIQTISFSTIEINSIEVYNKLMLNYGVIII